MCRLLCVTSAQPFPISDYVPRFAEMARQSKEYQGHGWGFACWAEHGWHIYRNVTPVWNDTDQPDFLTTLLLVHARSAFQNIGIDVANNMPFTSDRTAFIFNGELRGVRIRAEGRIGAEKIFNLIRSFDAGDQHMAVGKAMQLLEQRTTYIKAANLILSDGRQTVVASRFNEDAEYYSLHRTTEDGRQVICSEPLSGRGRWEAIPQGIYRVA